MNFSPQQGEAIAYIASWLRMKFHPFFYLGGYAGTGKTTLAKHIASMADGHVRFMAFTGKAAMVMRQKGCDGAATIHSSIYRPRGLNEDGDKRYVLDRSALNNVDLVILDECSMVNEELGKDLLSFGIPILVLGDPAQLAPVKGTGFFTKEVPDYTLTEVHRQAADSLILRLATTIRQGGWRPRSYASEQVNIVYEDHFDTDSLSKFDAVLCGKNRTRVDLNAAIRTQKGFEGRVPQWLETIVGLKNNHAESIWNGAQYTVQSVGKVESKRGHPDVVVMTCMLDDQDASIQSTMKVPLPFFDGMTEFGVVEKFGKKALHMRDQATFGYALTVHKSQGSQWSNVAVFDEGYCFREDRDRWLYTAVTRAADRLTLII